MPVDCLGCIVKPFTVPEQLASEVEVERHFRRQQDEHHTADLKRRTIEQLSGGAGPSHPAPSHAPRRDQLIDKWIQESAEEGYFLRDVTIGGDVTGGPGKQIDLVVVPTTIENPGSVQLADAQLVNRPVADPGPPKQTLPGSEFQRLLEYLDEPAIEVQVYTAERTLSPRSIGRVFFDARYLPDEAPRGMKIEVVHRGIIYVEPDPMTEEFAQEQGLSLHRISESAF